MRELNSLERLSTLIGAIYDCALSPEKWQSVVEALRFDGEYSYVVLGVYPLPSGTVALGAATGIEPAYLASLAGFGDDIVELWGGDRRVAEYPLEEPIVQSRVVPPPVLTASRYFRDWMLPQGIGDAIAIGLERNVRTVSTLSFGRDRNRAAIGEADLVPLRLLAPHIRRALAISQILDLQSIAAANMAAVFDALPTGMILVDKTMTLIHANPSAQAILARRDLLEIKQRRVMASSGIASVLATAVAQAAKDEASLGRRGGGTGIPMRDGAGTPHVIHVLPLSRRELRPGLFLRAAAALFIVPGDQAAAVPINAVAALYELTHAEARVFELIAEGLTRTMAAERLGLALSTVKSHLLHVLEKTGCARQADLVRLAASLRRPF